ncbi:MAG TPA: PAS domain S-box protein, partial [Candidatus Obscuribacterales bacterium]
MESAADELITSLRTTLGKMEVVLGAIDEAIAWTDANGCVEWSNAAFDSLVGRGHFQVLGARLIDLLPLEQQGKTIPAQEHPVNRALQSESNSTGMYEFRQADKKLRLSISWARIELKEQQKYAAIAIADITLHKQEKEELQQLVENRTASLIAANEQLQREISDRQQLEAALQQSEAKYRSLCDQLDNKVKERTAELEQAIEDLQSEIGKRQQAEIALRESEARYLSISELTSDYVYSVSITADAQLVSEWVTASFTRITGYSLDELNALGSWISLIHPDDLPIVEQLVKSILANQTLIKEYRIFTKQGEVCWLRDYARPEWDATQGRVVRVVGAVRDITQRKIAEAARRQIEERLRTQYKGIPVPTYTWQKVGEDFVLMDYNDAAEIITQGQIATLMGIKASVLYREQPEIVNQFSRCFLEKNTNKREMLYQLQTTGDRKHLAVSCVFVEPDLIMVHTEDITERKLAQEELERSLSLLQATLDSTTDGIIATNNECHIVCSNQKYREMWSLTDDILTSCNYEARLAYLMNQLKEPEVFLIKIQELTNQSDAESYDILELKDGRIFERHSQPQRLGNAIIGRVWWVRDITARKQMEAEIERSVSLLQATLDSTADGIISMNHDSTIFCFNKKYLEMWSLPEVNLTDPDFEKRFNPFLEQVKDPQTFVETLSNICSKTDAESYDFVELKNGKILERYSQPQWMGGTIVGRVWSFRDITARKQMEAEVERSLSLLKATINSTADGILALDNEGNIACLNEKFVELWSIPERVMASVDISQRLTFIIEQVKEPETFSTEFTQLHDQRDQESYKLLHLKNGRIFECQSQPQRLGDTIIGRVWCFRDVTQRQRMEAELERSLSLLQATIESGNDGILATETSGKITCCNKKFKEMWSMPDELIETLDVNQRIAFIRQQLKDPTAWIKQINELSNKLDISLCDTLELKDGRLIERQMQPYRLGETIIGRVFSFREVTASKQAEAELQAAKDQLQAVLDAVPGGVAWIDKDLQYIGVNSYLASIVGLVPNDFIGRNIDFINPTPAITTYLAEFFASSAKETSLEIEWEVDSKYVTYLAIAQKYLKGSAAVFVGIDITELKQAEKGLQDSVASIQALYEVTASRELNFDQRLQQMLTIGCQWFDLAIGFLSQLKGENLEVLACVSPNNVVPKGTIFRAEYTYCSEVLKTQDIVSFEVAKDTEWCYHPGYITNNQEAYIGAPLVVGDRIYGVIG